MEQCTMSLINKATGVNKNSVFVINNTLTNGLD